MDLDLMNGGRSGANEDRLLSRRKNVDGVEATRKCVRSRPWLRRSRRRRTDHSDLLKMPFVVAVLKGFECDVIDVLVSASRPDLVGDPLDRVGHAQVPMSAHGREDDGAERDGGDDGGDHVEPPASRKHTMSTFHRTKAVQRRISIVLVVEFFENSLGVVDFVWRESHVERELYDVVHVLEGGVGVEHVILKLNAAGGRNRNPIYPNGDVKLCTRRVPASDISSKLLYSVYQKPVVVKLKH